MAMRLRTFQCLLFPFLPYFLQIAVANVCHTESTIALQESYEIAKRPTGLICDINLSSWLVD